MIRRDKEEPRETLKDVVPDYSKRSEPVLGWDCGGIPHPKNAPVEKEPVWGDAREAVTSCGACGNMNFGLLSKGGEALSIWCTRCGATHTIAITTPHHLKQVGDYKNNLAGILLYTGEAKNK